MSAAKVFDRFVGMVSFLQETAKTHADGLGRRWFNPCATPLDDIPGMKEAFDRAEIGAAYAEAYKPDAPGPVGEAMSTKYQSDVLAAVERAFRLRHASPLRSDAHAAARRAGLASEDGTYQDVILRRAVDLLQAGQGRPDRGAGNTGGAA